jgi:hypothetical protein
MLTRNELRYMKALEAVLLAALNVIPCTESHLVGVVPKIKRLKAAALKAAKIRAELPD